MILVTVRDDEHLALAVMLEQMAVIGDDIVHTEEIVLGKTDTCINDQDLISMFKTVRVLADFTQSAKRVYHGIVFFDRCLIIFIAETIGFFRCVCAVIRIHIISFPMIYLMFRSNDCTLVHTIIA